MDRWLAWRDDRAKQRAARHIRRAIAAFGYPVDDMTDARLEDACLGVGEALRSVGVTEAEVADSLQRIRV